MKFYFGWRMDKAALPWLVERIGMMPPAQLAKVLPLFINEFFNKFNLMTNPYTGERIRSRTITRAARVGVAARLGRGRLSFYCVFDRRFDAWKAKILEYGGKIKPKRARILTLPNLLVVRPDARPRRFAARWWVVKRPGLEDKPILVRVPVEKARRVGRAPRPRRVRKPYLMPTPKRARRPYISTSEAYKTTRLAAMVRKRTRTKPGDILFYGRKETKIPAKYYFRTTLEYLATKVMEKANLLLAEIGELPFYYPHAAWPYRPKAQFFLEPPELELKIPWLEFVAFWQELSFPISEKDLARLLYGAHKAAWLMKHYRLSAEVPFVRGLPKPKRGGKIVALGQR